MDVDPALIDGVAGVGAGVNQPGCPVQVGSFGYIEQRQEVVKIAFQGGAHHKVAESLGNRVGGGGAVFLRRYPQIVEAAQEQVVFGGQKVGEEAVEDFAGFVIGGGAGDSDGGQGYQVFAEHIVLPEVVAELGDVEAAVAHFQDEGVCCHRFPLAVILGAQVIGQRHWYTP